MKAALHVIGVLSFLALSACSSEKPLTLIPEEEYALAIKEDRLQKRIVLTFRSFSTRALCLQYEQWPRDGKFPDATQYLYVLAGGEKYYYLKEHNFGYCPTDCTYRVEPGDVIESYIDFSEFPVAAFEDDTVNRQIVVPITPIRCES